MGVVLLMNARGGVNFTITCVEKIDKKIYRETFYSLFFPEGACLPGCEAERVCA